MERVFAIILIGGTTLVGAFVALVAVAIFVGKTATACTAIAMCCAFALMAARLVWQRRAAGRSSVGALVGPVVAIGLSLAAAGFIAYKLLSPERFPTVEPGQATQSVRLPGLDLGGQWPPPASFGPGWEISTDGETVSVRSECDVQDGNFGGCPTRFPRPSMTIRRATESSLASKLQRRVVGKDGRELRYDVTTSEEFRMCTSTMTGVLTLDGADYGVVCTYTTENWCGGGGKWCLELLSNLERL